MPIWPVHPHPLPDELLSSWMIRIARANGFKVHNFYALFFGRDRQIWNRDIDLHAPQWLLEGLSARTGTQPHRIYQTTLRAFESILFETYVEGGRNRWVLPLGIFHRVRKAYGQQFCPRCLGEDEVPYLRRAWRLAIVTVCAQHAIVLQDRCGSCGRALEPHRTDMVARHGCPQPAYLSHCASCNVSAR